MAHTTNSDNLSLATFPGKPQGLILLMSSLAKGGDQGKDGIICNPLCEAMLINDINLVTNRLFVGYTTAKVEVVN